MHSLHHQKPTEHFDLSLPTAGPHAVQHEEVPSFGHRHWQLAHTFPGCSLKSAPFPLPH